jgi:hypothetical protein
MYELEPEPIPITQAASSSISSSSSHGTVRSVPLSSSVHYDHAHAQSAAVAAQSNGLSGGAVYTTNGTTITVSTSSSRANSSSSIHPSSTMGVMRTIVSEEGWWGLTNGLGARIGKIAPACAIMITSYEIAKNYFAQPHAWLSSSSSSSSSSTVSKKPSTSSSSSIVKQ